MKKRKLLSRVMAVVLSAAMLLPVMVATGSADTGSESVASTSICTSTTRLSMTAQREVALSFNLGYKPQASDLEWTFGDKSLDLSLIHI